MRFRPRLVSSTERLEIRPLDHDHFDAWVDANRRRLPRQTPLDSDPRPPRALNRPQPGKIVHEQEAWRRDDRCYGFAFTARSDGRLVGTATVRVVARAGSQLGWLGYGLYNHEWGQGYAREGVREVVHLAFHELMLQRLEAGIRPENRPSIKLVRALGMKRSFFTELFQDGRWVELVVYATTAPAWGIAGRRPSIGLDRV